MVDWGHKPNGFARKMSSVQDFDSLSTKITRPYLTDYSVWIFLHLLSSHCHAIANGVCYNKSRLVGRRRKVFSKINSSFTPVQQLCSTWWCGVYQWRRLRPGQVVSSLVCSACCDPWQDLLEKMPLWSTCLQPQWQPLSNINFTHSSSSLYQCRYIAITTGVISPYILPIPQKDAACVSRQPTLVRVKIAITACSFTMRSWWRKKRGGARCCPRCWWMERTVFTEELACNHHIYYCWTEQCRLYFPCAFFWRRFTRTRHLAPCSKNSLL